MDSNYLAEGVHCHRVDGEHSRAKCICGLDGGTMQFLGEYIIWNDKTFMVQPTWFCGILQCF